MEGKEGDLPGYTQNPEDLRLKEVYRDLVHSNASTHLHGGIKYDVACQGRWRDLTVLTSWSYNAPSGKVGRCFVGYLVKELHGVQNRRWNLEWFIVSQMVILKRS